MRYPLSAPVAWVLLLFVGSVAACGSTPENAGEDYDRGEPVELDKLDAGSGSGGSGGSDGGLELGFQAKYPKGPYGVAQGSTVFNMKLLGWRNPKRDLAQLSQSAGGPSKETLATAVKLLKPIQLSDYYNPEAKQGVRLLWLSFVSVWCTVCQAEFAAIDRKGLADKYAKRGARLIGVLLEDAKAAPATYADLFGWSKSYNVAFPMLLDPGSESGRFFTIDATPANMLVDAKTMKIITHLPGGDLDGHVEVLDEELTKRGL